MQNRRLNGFGWGLCASANLVASLLSPTLSMADPTPAQLDSAISKAIQASENVPGVGVSVGVVQVKGGVGKLVYAKGFGYRDRARRLPATDHTTYVVGSMTKAFTVAALAVEAEAGRLDLGRPVREYAPDFTLGDERASREATAVDLLSHQTGLPRHDVFWYASTLARPELYARLRYLGPNLDPKQTFRRAYQYNNLIFMAAGRLLEHVSGDSWEKTVRARVLAPLGMDGVTLDVDGLRKSKEPSLGYAGEELLPYKDVESIAPAAAINADVHDLAQWLEFHLSGGLSPSGKRLLSSQSMETMYKPRIETVAGSGNWYAMGWRLDKWAKKRWIRHAGNMDGFLGLIGFVPESGLGTVVLTNQNDSPVPSAVTEAVMRAYLGAQGRARPTALDLAAEERGGGAAPVSRHGAEAVVPSATVAPVPASPALDGRYTNPAYGEMSVSNGTLVYGAHRWNMRPVSASKYGVTLDLGGRTQEFVLTFTLGSDGQATGFGVSFDETATPFRFAKI